MCSIRVLPANQLAPPHWQAWARIQEANPNLDSPFFRPELTRLVSSVRDDVEVAVIRNGARAVGFFPFQRGRRDICQAVVGRLSEFHGVVAEPNAEWTGDQLLRACGLQAWHFDHLPITQTMFRRHVWGESLSPYIDLSGGFDAYRAACAKSGSSFRQVERKARKMAREVGPLRFEFHTDNDEAFHKLLAWKTAQHARTKVLQVLKINWVARLLDGIRKSQNDAWGGVLSALYAGDELAAVHLGIRSRRALHMWFPAYNMQRDRYSPGLILLTELAKGAAERGIRRVDLGRGEERYKANFKSGDIRIAEGMVDRRWLAPRLRSGWYHAKRWIRQSPWRNKLEFPLTATRRLRQWLAFR